MRVRIVGLLDDIQSSYYFLPGLMALAAIILSVALVTLDRSLPFTLSERVGFVWSGGPEGARGLLSTVAGSMITVAGVTFSITMVAFSQAATQYGPRMLRVFMRDRGNQIVLGTFVATFVYSLLVLRAVRDGDLAFVPELSVTVALVFALASIGVLIYFIHHVSLQMQAPTVISQVAEELMRVIDHRYPPQREDDGASDDAPAGGLPRHFDMEAQPVRARGSGYLQAYDESALMSLASKNDVIIRLAREQGSFIIEGDVLAHVWPGASLTAEMAGQMQGALVLGRERRYSQDIQLAFEQLVEVAVRALSPSVNDPFTALACIDWLAAGLSRLARRPFPSPYRYDDEGQLRVVYKIVRFTQLAKTMFRHIAQYAQGSDTVKESLIRAVSLVVNQMDDVEERKTLQREVISL